jgi:hypothetical protein
MFSEMKTLFFAWNRKKYYGTEISVLYIKVVEKKMKTITNIILTLTAVINITLAQTTYNWVGGNSGNFTTATNWNPVRQISLATDILVFDNSGIIELLNVQQQTIGQLLISNNTNIILYPASGNSKCLSINGCSGTDLLIESGSSLEIQGNDPKLGIYLKTGATAEIYGSITLRGEMPHYLNAQDVNSFVFKSGSSLFQFTPGYVFTNAGTANAIVFEDGASLIIKNQVANTPFGLTAPASKVTFARNSKYSVQVNSASSLDFNNRTYGNLEIAANTTVHYQTSNLEYTYINSIIVNNNCHFNINNSNQNQTSMVHMYGILNINGYFTASNNISFLFASDVATVSEGDGMIGLNQNQMITSRNNNVKNNVSEVPEAFSLSQNYPNPFNPVTKIDFTVSKTSEVTIKLYDVNGKEVQILVNGTQESGKHTVTVNSSNLSSGTYFYTMTAKQNGTETFSKTMKMVVVK